MPAQALHGSPGAVDPVTLARAEIAATAVAVPPPAARGRRRTSAASWRGTTVAALALVMVACAAAGFLELRSRGDSDRRAQRAITVPGTGLVVDKPDGWTEGSIESAPAVLTDLVDVSDGDGRGLFFTASGGRALFVVEAPNSAGIDTVPPVPERIGAALVSAQSESAHDLGPARSVQAHGDDPGRPFSLDATYVLTEGRIVVVGGLAEGGFDPATTAAATSLLASLHPR